MVRWAYKIVWIEKGNDCELLLNALGEQGWELVNVRTEVEQRIDGRYRELGSRVGAEFVLKRPGPMVDPSSREIP
jgi:Fe2+ transport system protein FeoA